MGNPIGRRRSQGTRTGDTDPVLYEIGGYMQKRRRELNMTCAELAARVGTTERTLTRWESGKNGPLVLDWIAWCQALRLDWWPQEPGTF